MDPPAAPGALGPSLFARGDVLTTTWIEPGATSEQHRVRIAELGPSGWSAPQTVAEGDDLIANWADFPQLSKTRAGQVYVSYARRSGADKYAYSVELATAPEGIAKWQTLGFAHQDGTETEHGFVSMVPEGKGIRIFWLDGRAMAAKEKGPMSLRTAVIDRQTGKSERLDARTCDCCQTSAAMTEQGPVVVFRDRSEGEIRDVAIARRTPKGWTAPELVHADGWEFPGCPVNGPAVDARGRDVVVAWYTGSEGGVVNVAFSADSGKTFAAPTALDSASPLGRVDVVLLDGKRAAVSWLARSGQGAEVRVATVASSGTIAGVRTIAATSAERRSGFPRLASLGERLAVAWMDGQDPARLRVARFAVPKGGPPTKPHIDAQPRLGQPLADAGLQTLTGQPLSLQRLAHGHTLVLAFWASWCAPCQKELRLLGELSGKYPGAIFVAANIETLPAQRVRELATEWGFKGEVVRDAGLAAAVGAPPLPAIVVLDAQGRLRWLKLGAPSKAVLERAIIDATEASSSP